MARNVDNKALVRKRCAGRLPMPTTNRNWRCIRRPGLLFEILVPVWNQNSAFAGLLRLSLLLHNQKLRPRRWRGNRRRRSSTKSRLDDMRIQNNMLLDQMASLSATVDKFQSTKASVLWGRNYLVIVLNITPALPVQLGRSIFPIFANYLDSNN